MIEEFETDEELKELNEEQHLQNLQDIIASVAGIKNVDNDKELDDAYKDQYTTIQQKLRDRIVTELLRHYTDGYKVKLGMNKTFKRVLFWVCIIILAIFSIIFSCTLLNMEKLTDKNTIAGVVQTISVCVTFLTLIVSILKIITKYVFSDKDEEYITKIVEIIQNNDLENKKENIRARNGMTTTEKVNVDSTENKDK